MIAESTYRGRKNKLRKYIGSDHRIHCEVGARCHASFTHIEGRKGSGRDILYVVDSTLRSTEHYNH